MTRTSLSELFDSMYHGKQKFSEFISEPIDSLFHRKIIGLPRNQREVLVPEKRLRVYHSFLNLFLIEFLPINQEVVFSYRKGCSAYDAVAKHANSKYFFQTDISSFFSSINTNLVSKVITEGEKFCPAGDVLENLPRIIDLICIDDSLPMGFPCSAPMSNAVLLNFDNALEQHCMAHGLIYTRYSDDIIISAEDKDGLMDIKVVVQSLLTQHGAEGLKLNEKKSKNFRVGGKIVILGLMILPNGKVTIDSKVKRDIEVLLYRHSQGRAAFLAAIEKDEDRVKAKITGYLNYINSIDQEYLNKLRRDFGVTVIDTFLHRPLPKDKA
jgi:RNA-directed DNA polymerase